MNFLGGCCDILLPCRLSLEQLVIAADVTALIYKLFVCLLGYPPAVQAVIGAAG
jgi:hypothetical protein